MKVVFSDTTTIWFLLLCYPEPRLKAMIHCAIFYETKHCLVLQSHWNENVVQFFIDLVDIRSYGDASNQYVYRFKHDDYHWLVKKLAQWRKTLPCIGHGPADCAMQRLSVRASPRAPFFQWSTISSVQFTQATCTKKWMMVYKKVWTPIERDLSWAGLEFPIWRSDKRGTTPGACKVHVLWKYKLQYNGNYCVCLHWELTTYSNIFKDYFYTFIKCISWGRNRIQKNQWHAQ